ncbi:MAG: aminoglycoside phosphotransferase family protein, partial [Verrucomicrobiota bacterium]
VTQRLSLPGVIFHWRNTGRIDPAYARAAGKILAAIHRTSWGDDALRKQFATTPNFHKLRIEPYLVTSGRRNPALESYFLTAAEDLENTSLALVHGDFSPKNILLRTGTAEITILDCEVAWFGDPAFDIAFLLNHFFLKALHRPELKPGYFSLGSFFLEAYRPGLGAHWSVELEARAVRLLLLLLLARVDGKSPVEYLAEQTEKQRQIREFVTRELPDPPHGLGELSNRWMNDLT